MDIAVAHEVSRQRFVTHVNGQACVLEYALLDGVMTITRTFVVPELRGRGIAAELTRVALDVARTNGWKVIPECSYAALYFRRHVQYRDLLA